MSVGASKTAAFSGASRWVRTISAGMYWVQRKVLAMTKRASKKPDQQEAAGDEGRSKDATCTEERRFCFPHEDLGRQDAFRRQHLVSLVCELALSDDTKEGTSPILGLSGSWGSGKSWVAQKALIDLKCYGFATVSVSAWQRYGAENLALDILQQISTSVNAHFDGAASGSKKLREDIQKSKEQLKAVLRRVARGSVSHVVKLATGTPAAVAMGTQTPSPSP